MPRTPGQAGAGLDTDALAAVNDYIRALHDRGYATATRNLRANFLTEYLQHTLRETGAPALTAGQLMDPDHAAAWLQAAADGATRRRNTLRGPTAVAAHDSQRARIHTYNALAEHLGLPHRIPSPPPGQGETLTPQEAERLLHILATRRPTGSCAATTVRTAAVAALVAATGHTVPQLHHLDLDHVDLDHRPLPRVHLPDGPYPLDKNTTRILRRWLDARAHITAQLEGSDPGYLWIPTKPGRPRDGTPPPPPGLTRAAVRTLHSAHRTLVLQIFGTPLRPGALLAPARERTAR